MPDTLHTYWTTLSHQMCARHAGVEQGRMMSAEALTWQGKVFAFYSTKGGRVGLGCRIGREFDLSWLGLTDWQHLAPFKTKPPMKDWIVVGAGDQHRWQELADTCLKLAQTRKG